MSHATPPDNTQNFHLALVQQRYNADSVNLIVNVATSMQLQVRDWVRTTDDKIGKIAAIDTESMTASIKSLDNTRQGVVVLTFPLARLVKIDVEKYLPTASRHK